MSLETASLICAVIAAPLVSRLWPLITNPIAAGISRILPEGRLKRFLFISWDI